MPRLLTPLLLCLPIGLLVSGTGSAGEPCALDPTLASASSPEADAGRLAVARCFLGEGEQSTALGHVESLLASDADPLFASYAALIAAEAQLGLAHPKEAGELLEGIELPNGPAEQRAALLRGQALVETGDHKAGTSTLQALLDGPLGKPGVVPSPWGADPSEARRWIAISAEATGESDRAIQTWEAIWTSNPGSTREADAIARLAANGVTVPDASSEAGRATIALRIATLDTRHMYSPALELRELLPDDGSQRRTREMAQACFSARQYGRAIGLYSKITEPTPKERFDHALATSRTGDYGAAAQLYQGLVRASPTSKRKPDSAWVDKASYKLGYLAYDAGDLSVAVLLFREHLTRFPDTRQGSEARWFIGWSLVRLERYDEAEVAFAELVANHPKSTLLAGARYWVARTSGLRGDEAAERAGYEALLRSDPDTSYAWFAAGRLGRTWDAPAEAPRPDPASWLQRPAFVRGRALSAARLDGWARPELDSLVPSAKRAGKEGTLALAQALADAGLWTRARSLASPWCGTPSKRDGDPAAVRLCWPRPYDVANSKAAVTGGLGPHLPFAIMKAESGWKPWVTSPAGARGIMQMMPSLAETLHAEAHPGEPFDADALYEAEYNSELAIRELASLRSRLSDAGVEPALPLVIGSYNGGYNAVRRWLKTYPSPPEADRFAEDISYAETRRYVRRVLGTLQVYRYVYGDTP